MKCIFLKLTAFAMLATASGVYASSDGDESSSTTPQTLRGSFLNEDEGENSGWWWNRNAGSTDLSICSSACNCWWGGCSMPQCTSNCQCSGGRCNMPKCRSNCQCAGGGCNMSGCRSNCQCALGGCQRRGDEEDAGIDQLPFDGDEEEYDSDSGDFEYNEDVEDEEELDEDEAAVFAQA